MTIRSLIGLSLAVAACGQAPPTPPQDEPTGQVRDRSPGWHAPFDCYWERFGADERLEGWIADDRDFYGTALVFVTERARELPVSNNLQLHLRGDGDEPIEVRGFHGDYGARDFVSVSFGPDVRKALDVAGSIAVLRGEVELARLDMRGAPSELDLAACDPATGAKPFPEDWSRQPR